MLIVMWTLYLTSEYIHAHWFVANSVYLANSENLQIAIERSKPEIQQTGKC